MGLRGEGGGGSGDIHERGGENPMENEVRKENPTAQLLPSPLP